MALKKIKASLYNKSFVKRLVDIFLAALFLIISIPLFVAIPLLIVTTSGFPIFFIHKRNGKNGKVIGVVKFRSMVNGASEMQKKLSKLNESDGPTFKIQDDPRFTRTGRILSRTGLDELPQFLNVIKGDMSIVGPRPLPVYEARKLTKKQKMRELVKPGVTSSWVTEGAHNLSFKRWMDLDKAYVENANFFLDLKIIYKTFFLTLRSLINQMGKPLTLT